MTEAKLTKTLFIFVCIILVYIFLAKTKKINYRGFFVVVFKSESPGSIDVFHI